MVLVSNHVPWNKRCFLFHIRQYFASARAEQNSQWQKAMICTSLFFPSVVVAITGALNFIAISYDTVNAMPLSVMLKMVAVWLFVSFPLTIIGTIFGRHFVQKSDPPCRVNSIPRYVLLFNYSSFSAFCSGLSPLLPGLLLPLSLYRYLGSFRLGRYSSKCTSYLHHFGRISSTTCMDSCFWCISYWSW